MTGAAVRARFVLASLATWRVTHLLAEEDGPGDAVARLRERLGDRPVGRLMDCLYCLSVWVAAPMSFAVARRGRDAPLAWLALSGAACLLERATAEETSGESTEWEGVRHELLRQEAQGVRPAAAHAREPAGGAPAWSRTAGRGFER